VPLSLLRLQLFGGGALWFEDVFTLTGDLLTGNGRHRLYVHDRARMRCSGSICH
jgi:hypothetical protein